MQALEGGGGVGQPAHTGIPVGAPPCGVSVCVIIRKYEVSTGSWKFHCMQQQGLVRQQAPRHLGLPLGLGPRRRETTRIRNQVTATKGLSKPSSPYLLCESVCLITPLSIAAAMLVL